MSVREREEKGIKYVIIVRHRGQGSTVFRILMSPSKARVLLGEQTDSKYCGCQAKVY